MMKQWSTHMNLHSQGFQTEAEVQCKCPQVLRPAVVTCPKQAPNKWELSNQKFLPFLVWVNHNHSPAWIKVIWGGFPNLTSRCGKLWWGRCNWPGLILCTSASFAHILHVLVDSGHSRVDFSLVVRFLKACLKPLTSWQAWGPILKTPKPDYPCPKSI